MTDAPNPIVVFDGLCPLRNRYRLFGRRRTCWTAPGGWRDRVL